MRLTLTLWIKLKVSDTGGQQMIFVHARHEYRYECL